MGRLMSFLFIWQTIVLTPLSIGGGAVGFAQYTKYLYKDLTWGQEKLIAMAVCLLLTALLYRDIRSIGRLSVVMWTVVIGTAMWIAITGLWHFDARLAFAFPPGAFTPSRAFFYGLGGATLIAMYDYGGYNNVCFFAGEVKQPERVIPRAILLSIVAVAALYLTMNITILGVVPWQEAIKSTAIVSDFIQRIHGQRAATVVTVLILWTTFASVFAAMLGLSRVPYAAAVEGRFFRPFARLHPTRNCPGFSLWFLGTGSALACLLTLDTLINALIVIQVLIQFLAQVAAVPLIRRNRPDIVRPVPDAALSLDRDAGLRRLAVYPGRQRLAVYRRRNRIARGRHRAYLLRARGSREWPFEAAT